MYTVNADLAECAPITTITHIIGGVYHAACLQAKGCAAQVLQIIVVMLLLQAQMADLADAFIAIPGGFGTLEELLEVITWNQIGFMVKPVGVLNICGYFDHLLKFFDHAVQEVWPTSCPSLDIFLLAIISPVWLAYMCCK